MKTPFLNLSIFIVLLLFSNSIYSQFSFSVSPGIQINNASFGFKKNKIKPNFGIQILTGSTSLTESGKRYDYDVQDIVNYEEKYKYSGLAIMPIIGLQYYFKESEKLSVFTTINFTKVFISGKIEDSTNPNANSELNDLVKKVNVVGGQVGFGTEYFFDKYFSVGGEFGIRIFYANYTEEHNHSVYNPNTGESVDSKINFKYNFSMNPTYSKISLNYYFSK